MYLVKSGTPIQRLASDGGKLTDTPGVPEVAEKDYVVYDEAVLLTPEENDGKWLFVLHSALLWEIAKEHVEDGKRRQFHQ